MINLPLAIGWYTIFLLSTILHEAAHALAAAKFGDRTAYHHGLITIDPLPHIKRSPFGMLVIPAISFITAGWMIGWASTPYDPSWAQYHRKKAALMSLAGPAANLLLVLIAAILIRLGLSNGFFYAPESVTFSQVTASAQQGLPNAASVLLSILFSLNLILLVFNLIPLPPLDGSNVLSFFLSDKTAQRYTSLLYHPTYRIMGLIIAWQIFGSLFNPVHTLALNLLYPGASYH